MKQRDTTKGDIQLVDDVRSLDPKGGVLVSATYWRPRERDPDPEHPGEKISIVSYLPTDAKDFCPCGSGKSFDACCRPLPYWRVVCPNPGMEGFSLMRSQKARFTHIPVDAVHAFLQDDERLYCVEDRSQRAFWIYWGDPAFDALYGTVCFGDFELKGTHTLLITALSDTRMEILLELVRPLNLGTPKIQLEPFIHVEKPVSRALGGKRRRKL